MNEGQIDKVRNLLRAFVARRRQRHTEDRQTCEMKRMFVYPQFHGKRIGRALAERLIEGARSIGYSSMLLDTSFRQTEAQNLYKKMRFKPIESHDELPDRLKNWLVFMALNL